MNRLLFVRGISLLLLVSSPASPAWAQTQPLDRRLLTENPAALVRTARIDGDARRGAVLFFRADLTCAKCHAAGVHGSELGPDLAAPEPRLTPEELVASLLEPSKAIRAGYETVTIATTDGRVITGIRPKERADSLVLLDPAHPDIPITIAKAEIAERRVGGDSVMPSGLVNTMASRGEFLDLLRYLLEIREGGPERARMLKPSAFELAPPPLPEYEKHLDHATFVGALGDESAKRGEEIYRRVCASCHGTPQGDGSLPGSPKFWADRLKSGGDPLRMYETITRGQGLMPPQTWLVPRQKYDAIAYIREHFLKSKNPSQFVAINAGYLTSLPAGKELGPEPSDVDPWSAMDYGPTLTATIELQRGSGCFAYKGIAVRLDEGTGGISQGRSWAVYDHDTMRYVGAWTGTGFIDWNGINFNGRHEIHPASVGRVEFRNANAPGWAKPGTLNLDDPRPRGRDGVAYGPMPREWLHYRGRYQHGASVILSYTVGDAEILECAGLEFLDKAAAQPVFTRTFEVGKSARDLTVRLGHAPISAAIVGEPSARLIESDGERLLNFPAGSTPMRCKVLLRGGTADEHEAERLRGLANRSPAPEALEPLTHGGPRLWPEVLDASIARFDDEGPFGIDVFTLPDANPWRALIRPTGFDFVDGGAAAVLCTWDGDVWRVDGLDDAAGALKWRRIASGLFQPLGLKVVNGVIHVGCRDQIAILRDLNRDGEIDFYENFNNDHQVTEHFHEFAMGLQTDAQGNFYYAKAARHGAKALVPQHGTLLRVSRDGLRTDILATGFRAPNGVCINGDGTFFVTDQEGHWIPKNRLNWVKPNRFYGNMWAFTNVTDSSDSVMEPPVCWLTNTFDRSPAEPLYVTSERWGRLKGSLLSLSYGYGEVFLAPFERVGDLMQGAMVALPLPRFPTGLIRGRFNPADGQLYVCGMYSWAGSQTRPGGFFRIRSTGRPTFLPINVHARSDGFELTFTEPIDPATALETSRYGYKTWSLERTANYGSPHMNERTHEVRSARLLEGGRVLRIEIAGFGPTQCYELRYDMRGADGNPAAGVLHGTVHAVAD